MIKIDKDLNRFKEIVKGKVRKGLKKFINYGKMIGKRGKNSVIISIPQMDIPHIRHNDKKSGGIDSGDGEIGSVLGSDGSSQKGDGPGNAPGEHYKEVEISLEELAKIMGEQLKLPNIKPKGKKNIMSKSDKYNSVRRVGPEGLRLFKKTFKEALKRQITEDDYNENDPVIIPVKEDRRYRFWKTIFDPEASAVIFFGMDISGSMGYEEVKRVRQTAFWIDVWLRYQYKKVERVYIVHDAKATEVDEEHFYSLSSSGGTQISSCLTKMEKIIKQRYSPQEWNVYIFYFSDGDNLPDDNKECEAAIKHLLPSINQFSLGQVDDRGDFMNYIKSRFQEEKNIVITPIFSDDKIWEAIKTFLGGGN